MSAHDEKQLAAAFLRGDEAAFRALHRLHSPALLAFTQRILGAQAR